MITSSFAPSSPALISPKMLVHPVPDFPDTLIVTFQEKTFQTLLAAHPATWLTTVHIEEDPGRAGCGNIHLLAHQGHRFGAYLSPAGAPLAVADMEQAIALGARRFIVFGTCGTLQPGLDPQAVIVPTAAYRDEGTSYHYAPASDYIELTTAGRLAGILTGLGVPQVGGRVWTTDAFFRETRAGADARREEGCLAVDMEASALAALAQFRGVEVYHFLYGADALEEEWEPRTLGTLPAEPRLRFAEIALGVAAALADRG